MTISANWLYSGCLFGLDPLILLRVKDAQLAVVLLAIVAAEDVKLFVVESSRVVLDLGRALTCLNLSLLVELSGESL